MYRCLCYTGLAVYISKPETKIKKPFTRALALIIVLALMAALLFAWAIYSDVIVLRKTQDMAGSKDAITILFVGDSFVFVGSLPKQLQTVAGAYGIEINYKDLSRHANRGGTLREHKENAIKEMQSGRFDYVVLHDQNTQSLNDIAGLQDDIRTLCGAAKENGVVPVLYDLAGIAAYGRPDEDRLRVSIDAYKQAADENGAILIRAAEAWIYAYQEIPGVSLYTRHDPRGLHPNKAGGFMSACVFAAALFDVHVESVPKNSLYKGKDGAALAQAAWEFVQSSR